MNKIKLENLYAFAIDCNDPKNAKFFEEKILKVFFLFNFIFITCFAFGNSLLNKKGTQWQPVVEWTLKNTDYSGNPFDLEANVTFVHDSGETITTGMFYDGDDTWKFRVTGTRTGEWKFSTSSEDPELDEKTGTVFIEPNPDKTAHGFITNFGNKWGWTGTDEAFVPQLVMYDDPTVFYNKPSKIDNDIQTFLVDHGFNGFHTSVLCRWFNLNKTRYDDIESENPNPDIRTFEALELLINKIHAAGGMVHLWAWGDEQRHMTPIKWGKNGAVDKRLLRYIAARLGPLPGWSMGYGFDLFEWVSENDLKRWHDFMHDQLGWFHFLGGRPGGPRSGTDHSDYQIYEGLDYSSYEHHKPTYEVYVAALKARPSKPVFSEDRFRIRQPSPYPHKDYNEVEVRRGLWISTMAGGVANIWGDLTKGGSGNSGSRPFDHPEWIKTYSRFFKHRFKKDMVRNNTISDGYCLMRPDHAHYVFYKENTDSIELDLSNMKGSQPVIAVDAKKVYTEIDVGLLPAKKHVWNAPHKSDWAIAAGDF